MPKAICKKCGKAWYGWALKYKDCYCDCGEKLKIKEGNKTKNIYKDIYPNADWTYTYECPQCCEPVPLKLVNTESRTLGGHCKNCHLDIEILEEDFLEWKENIEKGD